jgi:hypothetical protein
VAAYCTPTAVADEGHSFVATRARGLAAGTLLACGSVLAITVHATDSSAPRDSATSGLVTIGPGATSGGDGATSLASRRTTAAPAATSAQAFTGTPLRSQPVHRNVPLAVPVPGAAQPEAELPAPLALPVPDRGQLEQNGPLERAVLSQAPVPDAAGAAAGQADKLVAPADQALTPATPVAAPATAPVHEVVAPVGEVLESVGEVVAPLEAAVQPVAHPAATMLSSLPLALSSLPLAQS